MDRIVGALNQGCSTDEIVRKFPTLDVADVNAVTEYYHSHRDQVETYVQDREREAAELRRQVEEKFPPEGVRDRLLARQTRPT